MKKYLKKLVPLFFAVLLAVSFSATVQAKTITMDQETVTFYSKSSKEYSSFAGGYITANKSNILKVVSKKAKISSLKSSDKNVASLFVKDGKGSAKGMKAIMLSAKKAGTVTVSFKVGSDTYKGKITVKKYVSPFSAIKLGNLNLTSKFKSNGTYVLPYSKYAGKTLKLSYKTQKGWSVYAGYLLKPGDMKADIVNNNTTFKVKKKNSALILNASNTKTNQHISCMIIFK